MKLTILVFFLGLMGLSASTYSQKTKLSIDLKDVYITEVIKSIENQSEFVFIYEKAALNFDKRVSITVRETSVDKILSEVLKDTGTSFEIVDKQIIITKSVSESELLTLKSDLNTEGQQILKKELSGTVSDSQGVPLPGVTVMVKGTTIGIVTDNDGKFKLLVSMDAKILVFSFIGMKTQEFPLAGKTIFSVVMVEATVAMEDVIVVGYGTQKKTTMTGAVSNIKGESLLTSPVTNISNSIQGKVTGVTTMQQNGQAGLQNADIFIRGRATLGDATAIVIVDGVERANFGSMDPNEIESITVLKDASSTAIFGIRGANGVLIITTKRGKESKPTVNYSGNITGNYYMDSPEVLNGYETAKLQNVGAYNNGKSTGLNFYWTDAELEHFQKQDLPFQYPSVDWMKTVTRKFNFQTQHNLSVQGGTKKVKYFISAGYMNTDGILKEFPSTLGIKTTDSYSKYNLRSNLDFDVTKDLRISLKVAGTMENIYQPGNQSGGTLGEVFYNLLLTPSNRSPVYTPDGRYAVGFYTPTSIAQNPIGQITQTGYLDGQKNKLEANLDVDLKMDWLTKGLTFKTLISYDNAMNSYLQQSGAYSAYYIDRKTGDIFKHPSFLDDTALGALSSNGVWGAGGALSYDLQTGFDYAREFGKHNITGLLRGTRRMTQISGGADAPYVYQGAVSRLTYNYDNKYLLEGSIAYNGSENFPKGKRYGLFPAGSAGYIISNENFFKDNISFMNLLKIRGSLGLVGNDKFPGGTARYLYLDEYTVGSTTRNWTRNGITTPGNSYYFGQPNAASKFDVMAHSRIGNPNITWETGLKADIGIETGFFNDRIKVTADYFHERRSDILMDPRSGLATYGEDYPKLNRGVVDNKGYEIELDMHDKFGEFTLGLITSISHSSNMVINADDPAGIPDYQKLAGKRVGQFFGYSTAGFYNSQQEIDDSNNGVAGAWPKNMMSKVVPGDLKFIDYNKDGIINSMDSHPILTSNLPEYNYSFTPSVSYKNFSLLLMFQGTMKSMSNFLPVWSYFGFMKDSWTPENIATGKTIVWPAVRDDWGGPSVAYSNDFVIRPNDYLKLRNFELAYQVPTGFAKRLSMSSVRLYISGQNLITWSKFMDFFGVDPEITVGAPYVGINNRAKEYAYPLARSINFGVNVQF